MNQDTLNGFIIGLAIAIVVVAVNYNHQWYELKEDKAVLEAEKQQLYERLIP